MFQDLAEKTKAQLIELGSSIGLHLNERAKKEDLISEIESSLKKVSKPSDSYDDKKNYFKHAKFAKFKKEGI